MIFQDVLNHFNITGDFPDYILNQTFNKVFLDGDLEVNNSSYKISITTRQNVTHQMFIDEGNEFPVIILSKLPNGRLNGVKFPKNSEEVVYINQL